jgi:hypothetical protein
VNDCFLTLPATHLPTHGQQSAAQGSSTTVSRSDIRLIQHVLLGSWFGPEVALDWLFPHPLSTHLPTQLSPRMRQLQHFPPLRNMVRRFGQAAGSRDATRPLILTPRVLDGDASDVDHTPCDSDAGLSDIGLVELPLEVTRMRTSLPLLIQGLQQHLEQAEAMHESSKQLPSPTTPKRGEASPGWLSSRDRVAYLQQALAAAEKAASQRMSALEGRLAKAEMAAARAAAAAIVAAANATAASPKGDNVSGPGAFSPHGSRGRAVPPVVVGLSQLPRPPCLTRPSQARLQHRELSHCVSHCVSHPLRLPHSRSGGAATRAGAARGGGGAHAARFGGEKLSVPWQSS